MKINSIDKTPVLSQTDAITFRNNGANEFLNESPSIYGGGKQ